jgi:hypothetical protein
MSITIRWCALVGLFTIAFARCMSSVVNQTQQGAPLAYLLAIPVWGLIITVGLDIRRRDELTIHDRQVDWIAALGVGTMLAFELFLLAPRLGATSHLIRVDVLAAGTFLFLGSVLLFGVRPTGRYWPAWIFLLWLWPLPYLLVGPSYGGTPTGYGVMNAGLGAIAVAISVGGRFRRWGFALACALSLSWLALAILRSMTSEGMALQLVPAIVGPVIVFAAAVIIRARRDSLRQLPDHPKLAVRRPTGGVLAIAAVAMVVVWTPSVVPQQLAVASLVQGSPPSRALVLSDGWHTASTRSYSWPSIYFGPSATWRRYAVILGPDSKDAVAGSSSRSAEAYVDVLTSDSLGLLNSYPSVLCYLENAQYASSSNANLGHGVSASTYVSNLSGVISDSATPWILLTWTERSGSAASPEFERYSVVMSDGSPTLSGLPTPGPVNGNNDVRTILSSIARGTPPVVSGIAHTEPFRQSVALARVVVRDSLPPRHSGSAT